MTRLESDLRITGYLIDILLPDHWDDVSGKVFAHGYHRAWFDGVRTIILQEMRRDGLPYHMPEIIIREDGVKPVHFSGHSRRKIVGQLENAL